MSESEGSPEKGIEAQRRFRLIEEVRQQCRFAQMALRQFKSELWAMDSERIFMFVHAFLGHALYLSRLFWPDRKASAERGEVLRRELKVADDSSLQLRTIRDELERPDERLEDWMQGLEHPNFFQMNVMPQGTLEGYRKDAFHRSLDPDTLRFEYRGVPCNLKQLSEEMRKIESNCDYWLRRHNPW